MVAAAVAAAQGAAPPSAAICLTGSLRSAAVNPEASFVEPFRSSVLAQFESAGYAVDVLVVTSARECDATAAALSNLRPKAVKCIDEEAFSVPERRWLEEGPRTVWSREAFLGQLKKVRLCADLAEEARPPEGYRLVARGRLDVRWHRFPRDPGSLEVPGVVWVPWRSGDSMAQYINDCFAVGQPAEMSPYLRAYDLLLDEGSAALLRTFEATPDGLDTEEVWELSLIKAGVLARQHRDICFNVLPKSESDTHLAPDGSVEDNCQTTPRSVHPRGYNLDDMWARIPLKSLPAQFEYDAHLGARLLHLWLAEWARTGRPAKVADLGCGRGTLVEQWLRVHPASIICVDMMPELRRVLGDDFLQADLALPVYPSAFGRPRGCSFAPPRAHPSATLGQAEGDLARLLRGCCLLPGCRGVNAEAETVVGLHHGWVPTQEDWLLQPTNRSRRGTVPWAGGRADWAVLLDVAGGVPRAHRAALFENVARFAGEGVVTLWGAGSPEPSPHPLEGLGFLRDPATEDWLRPFARGPRRQLGLRVFRRAGVREAALCSLELHRDWSFASKEQCKFGLSFGCVDNTHMWVSDGCDGVFARGGAEVACLSDSGKLADRSNWTQTPQHQYVECVLPERQGRAPEADAPAAAGTGEVRLCGPSGSRRLAMEVVRGEASAGLLAVSEPLPTVMAPLIAVWVGKGATHLEMAPAAAGRGPWPAQLTAPAGDRCLILNAWPALGHPVRLLAGWGERGPPEPTPAMPPISRTGVWAEALARQVGIRGGLAGMYDMLDPGAAWGNQSRVWRALAWGRKAEDADPWHRPAAVLTAVARIEAFSAFVSALRAVAAAIAEPLAARASEAAAALARALQEAAAPWGPCGVRLLATAGLLAGPAPRARAGARNATEGVRRTVRGCGVRLVAACLPMRSQGGDTVEACRAIRLQFPHSQHAHYLYHRATLAD